MTGFGKLLNLGDSNTSKRLKSFYSHYTEQILYRKNSPRRHWNLPISTETYPKRIQQNKVP
jgi:hypothetical protein